jgi:L-2-hydroxyglutarate oxidase LhgO
MLTTFSIYQRNPFTHADPIVSMLQAQLCVKGNKMLYDYANSHNISYKKVGKLVVACGEDEIPKLTKLYVSGNRIPYPRGSVPQVRKTRAWDSVIIAGKRTQ